MDGVKTLIAVKEVAVFTAGFGLGASLVLYGCVKRYRANAECMFDLMDAMSVETNRAEAARREFETAMRSDGDAVGIGS